MSDYEKTMIKMLGDICEELRKANSLKQLEQHSMDKLADVFQRMVDKNVEYQNAIMETENTKKRAIPNLDLPHKKV